MNKAVYGVVAAIGGVQLYKSLCKSKHSTQHFLDEFQTLPFGALPDGEYRARYENADTFNVFVYALVAAVWKGGVLQDGVWSTTLNVGTSSERGDVTVGAASVLDGRPCVRVDFSWRFYEVRPRADGSFLSIVRQEGRVLDVHVLKLISGGC